MQAEWAEARSAELEQHLQAAQEALRQVELARPAVPLSQQPAATSTGPAASGFSRSPRSLVDLDDLEVLAGLAAGRRPLRQPHQDEDCASERSDGSMQHAASSSEVGSELALREQEMRGLLRQLLQQQARSVAAAQEQLPPNVAWEAGTQEEAVRLRGQLAKLQQRNVRLQAALADAHLQLARRAAAAERGLGAARQEGDAALAAQERAQAAGASAAQTAASQEVERLHGQVADCVAKLAAAQEQSSQLLREKQGLLEALAGTERELEERTAELARLRMQRLCLAAGAGDERGGGAGGSSGSSWGEQCQRVLLEAQAADAAMRSVLAEARQQQLAACRSLSAELRRVHALTEQRSGDLQEMQRLRQRLAELGACGL